MAIYQGLEPAVIFADFLVDARVQLIIQRHHQVSLGGAVLSQVVRLLRIFLQVVEAKIRAAKLYAIALPQYGSIGPAQ